MSTTFHRSPGWWYAHPETNGDHIIVLNALMLHADAKTFTCFPSQGRIGEMLKRSRAWVNKIIRELVEFGFIQKTHRTRKDRGMSSCEYRIVYHDPRVPDDDMGSKSSGNHDFSDAPTVTGDVNQDDTNKTQTKNHTLSEISIEDWVPAPSTLETMTAASGKSIAERFVAKFRRKVAEKGYQYADFDVAVLEWFEADQQRGLVTQNKTRPSRTDRNKRSTSPAPSPQIDFTEFLNTSEVISTPVRTAVVRIGEGKPVSPDLDEASRFRAACLLLARTKGVGFYKAWLAELECVDNLGGVMRVSGGTRFQRAHVETNCDSDLLACCRMLGINLHRLRYVP
ncbi:helix-turn-helix domain-containing protein [Salipiger mucosus]|uniref:Helix-turn-helix domain-containing protein n=1 Tax=Salipiger mucosus DSM 16094 TaxID=1123237 RepID=S9SCS2_9RHOB|nr:helix-turn-helix domain-containing protein [Salipiger mucosus]EPX84029.1 hypothetical protein Salmuc_01804 [Salipiger mucosus DSM 16094]